MARGDNVGAGLGSCRLGREERDEVSGWTGSPGAPSRSTERLCGGAVGLWGQRAAGQLGSWLPLLGLQGGGWSQLLLQPCRVRDRRGCAPFPGPGG